MISTTDRDLMSLLALIAQRSAERGSLLSKTRFVKFLYLLDLYHAQAEKRTFTGWPWAFVHYGPYCRESTDAIDHAEAVGYLVARSYESKFRDEDFRLYGPGNKLDEYQLVDARTQLPTYVSSHLLADIHKWCDDTFSLLDYVYFHTGPMLDAVPGERLSFQGEEKIDYSKFKPVEPAPLSKDKRKAAREVLEEMKSKKTAPSVDPSLYDEHYFESLSSIAGEETPVGLTGTARLRVGDLPDD